MEINGTALRAFREKSDLSVTALAARVGVKQPHLSLIEKCERGASDELVLKLAGALEVPVDALVLDPVRRRKVRARKTGEQA